MQETLFRLQIHQGRVFSGPKSPRQGCTTQKSGLGMQQQIGSHNPNIQISNLEVPVGMVDGILTKLRNPVKQDLWLTDRFSTSVNHPLFLSLLYIPNVCQLVLLPMSQRMLDCRVAWTMRAAKARRQSRHLSLADFVAVGPGGRLAAMAVSLGTNSISPTAAPLFARNLHRRMSRSSACVDPTPLAILFAQGLKIHSEPSTAYSNASGDASVPRLRAPLTRPINQ